MSASHTPAQRAQASFDRLSKVAVQLNSASDELTKSIETLDLKLKRLNLGISSWYKYAGVEGEQDGIYWGHYIGYARISNRWGIAIKKDSGHEHIPDSHSEDSWIFSDAPRQLRAEASDYLPELIDKLISDCENTIKKINTRVSETRQIADALPAGPSPRPAPRG